MIARRTGVAAPWILLLSLVLASSVTFAQTDIEDPSLYPGSWYRLVLDANSQYVRGDGDGYGGGTWYHYPQTGWYRQWFYNGAYSPDRKGSLRYEVYIRAVDPTKTTYVEINFNWATPEWSLLRLGRPPLPDDARTEDQESRYMTGQALFVVDDWFIGTVEPIKTLVIDAYNPEWVSIDIRGRNAYVYRGAMHECVGQQGACCDPETGECFLSLQGDCNAPYRWLGGGTTCEQCRQGMSALDFGDAPDTYGTSMASNGARHTVVAGVYLGQTVDMELDAPAGPTATGDDVQGEDDEDGVVFTSPLSPGTSAAVEVTASIQGYLNAWIDFNQDGDFEDSGEQVFADELLTRGVNKLTIPIPGSTPTGDTFARFRFNTRGLLFSTGPATDGEVEDYKVVIAEVLEPQPNVGAGGLKWSQSPQAFDAGTPYILNAWAEPSGLHLRQIAADDWECRDNQPVTGFQWWGSFQGWKESLLPSEQPLGFQLALWTQATDPTATDPTRAGHPDTLIWETFCTNWTWSIAGYDSDPRKLQDDTCFQFTYLLSQDQWFYPALASDKNGAATPTVYWLSIAAVYDTRAAAPEHPWGWTTRPHSFGSGAYGIQEVLPIGAGVASWPPVVGSRWAVGVPVEEPQGVAWDLAFTLLTNQASVAERRDLAPVYRFWSEQLTAHFYTISEAEKDRLLRDYPTIWKLECIAFYAYPPETAPVGTKPVYRFWSEKLNRHFYTMSEAEKQRMLDQYAEVWKLEGIAWYAFD